MSITVPLEGFGGGGGASLNFDVKAYSTEEALLAATPKENTIGVITATAITSWIFSATEPEAPVEGMVWISTGTSSSVEFNALKKNAIQVYPLSAKQYVGGEWANVTAMSYQGGEWVKFWDGKLYEAGNEFENITGGWGSTVNITEWNGVAVTENAATKHSEYINIAASGTYTAGVVNTLKKIDVTECNAITANVSVNAIEARLMLVSDLTFSLTSNADNKTLAMLRITNTGSTDAVLDVSSVSGEAYVVFMALRGISSDPVANFDIHKVSLIR